MSEKLSNNDLESAIGGRYKMPDGRDFWIDSAVAREIIRRIGLAEIRKSEEIGASND